MDDKSRNRIVILCVTIPSWAADQPSVTLDLQEARSALAFSPHPCLHNY